MLITKLSWYRGFQFLTWLISILFSSVLSSFADSSLSFTDCGARPIGIGGAFVGVSDDVNAVNWNPAGLAQLSQRSLTAMINTEFDRFRCDALLGLAHPVGKFGTVGIAYGGNWDPSITHSNGSNSFIKISDQENDFFHLALGKYLFRDYLALGVTGIWESKRFDFDEVTFDATSTILSWQQGGERIERFDLDVGAMAMFGKKADNHRMFSLGLLFQNVFKTEWNEVSNLRSGIAVRPDKKTICSADINDLAGATKGEVFDISQDISLGIERWFNLWKKEFALRTGAYHLNNEDLRAYTIGIGLKFIPVDFTWVRLDKERTTTHLISLTASF